MEAWWQCEVPYPFVPRQVLDAAESVRGSLPNRYCDPRIAADLFEEVIDEFLLCDEMGMNVLAIEHHAGINSLLEHGVSLGFNVSPVADVEGRCAPEGIVDVREIKPRVGSDREAGHRSRVGL